MATAQDLINVAMSQVGVTEYPANSNKVKYNTWYYGREVSGSAYPWCVVFVAWCFNQLGALNTLFPRMASCGQSIRWFEARGHRNIGFNNIQPGDIVYLKQSHAHIEIAVSYPKGGSVRTIGGNTSSGSSGSQANGGGVFQRTRYNSGEWAIRYVYRPLYDGVSTYSPIVDPSWKWKLANILMYNNQHKDKLVGQLAKGDSNDNCLRVRKYDESSKTVREIQKIARVNEVGQVQYLTKRLQRVSDSSGYAYGMSGVFQCDSPYQFSINKGNEFLIDIGFFIYRPTGYTKSIYLVTNRGRNQVGYALYVDSSNRICFNYNTGYNSETFVWDTKLDTTGSVHNFNGESHIYGDNYYNIKLEKSAGSNDFTLYINSTKIGSSKTPKYDLYSVWSKSGGGTSQILKIGDYGTDPITNSPVPFTLITSDVILKGTDNRSSQAKNFTSSTSSIDPISKVLYNSIG